MPARILVCDDESGLREMLGVLFRRAGFLVELVDGVGSALRAIEHDPPYDAVITDLIMPGGSGMQVLEAARASSSSTTAWTNGPRSRGSMRRPWSVESASCVRRPTW